MISTDIERMPWGAVLSMANAGQLPGVLVHSTPERVAHVLGGKGVAYVATPYSREAVDGNGLWSFECSGRAAHLAAIELNQLRLAGVSAISPIVQAHAMIGATGFKQAIGESGAVAFVPRIDPLDAALWMRWCRPLIAASSCMVVPELPGWERSSGIRAEFITAINQGKPVFFYAGAV